MSAISSNGTGGGNWSSTSTWSGGVVPSSGSGDTVTIQPGDTVYVDSASESSGQLLIGSDPGTGGTAAITVGSTSGSSGANLVVNSGVTLRMRGDLTINGGSSSYSIISKVTLSEGSTLIWDPSSGNNYLANFNYGAQIVANGATNTGTWPDTSGGNHVTIKTDLSRGGSACYTVIGGGYPNTGSVIGGFISSTFTDFVNMGQTSGNTIGVMIYTYNGANDSTNHTVQNCTFTSSNFWDLSEGSGPWAGNLTFNYVIFSSSAAAGPSWANGACCGLSYNNATGTRTISNSAFDLLMVNDGGSNNSYTGCVFGGGWSHANSASWSSSSYFNNNLVVFPGNDTSTWYPIHDCYFVNTNTSNSSVTFGANMTFTNCIFDNPTSASTQFVLKPDGTGLTFLKCFFLPASGSQYTPYVLWFVYGNQGGIVAEHCLYFGNSSNPFLELSYGANAAAGTVTSCRSNIIYSPGTGYSEVYAIAEDDNSSYTVNAVTLAGYNGYYNPNTGTCKYNSTTSQSGVTGYSKLAVSNANPFPNSQVGVGDFTASPSFTDTNYRTLATWGYREQGTANSVAGALGALLANPGLLSGSNGLLYWVRAGYVPTNSAYANATYSGDATTTDANGNAMNGTVGPMGYPSSGGLAYSLATSVLLPRSRRMSGPAIPALYG